MPAKTSPVAVWLFTVAAAVFLITLVGAVTRITESGLSIVEWKPVTGALPPLSESAWQAEFDLYKTSPQYKKVNAGMSLGDFKKIFFWEWLHRLIGRTIGLLYALPLAWFWLRGKIPADKKKPLLGILALGFLQGALGWYMVKSGLVDRPAVSHYRLAAHLMLAVTIYCCLLRAAFSFLSAPRSIAPALRGFARFTVAAVAVTMVWGAFTAGLRAGQVYNDTFPLMGAHLWPGEMFFLSPWWMNFFENHAAVQFTHRALALLSFCALLGLSLRGLFLAPSSGLLRALLAMAFVQVGLGIATLLSHVGVAIATAHQAGAMVIMGLLMALLHNISSTGEKR
jgi:cytochrome c oxidase assembly protein subunit 15